MRYFSHFNQFLLYLTCATWLASGALSKANVRLPRLVGDHMVLQRDQPLRVWGWAKPDESVTVTWQSHPYPTKADAQGQWAVQLPATKAGGPFEMTIQGNNQITINDILVGDVWVCSGQSNMEWVVADAKNGPAEVAQANFPNIRLFSVKNTRRFEPANDVLSDGWQTCSPATTKDFSAVGYFFGRDLHQHLRVPIGLIASEWGGTPVEAWTSAETLKTFPDQAKALAAMEERARNAEAYQRKRQLAVETWLKSTEEEDQGLAGRWMDPATDAKGWKSLPVPGFWEANGLPDFNGVVWLRREVTLPATLAGKDLHLSLALIDDIDFSYFNGALVGHTGYYDSLRHYSVPGRLVKAGRNVIAVRVIDHGGGGGIFGNPDLIKLDGDGQSLPLTGTWQAQVGVDAGKLPPYPSESSGSYWQPAALYNGMIAPLTRYVIKGVVWYQGEANVRDAFAYRKRFPALMTDWRQRWQQGNFPFLFVQLANFNSVGTPDDGDWATLRESQLKSLAVPNTGMAVTIDIGEANDIHPRNKQDVGKRLALAAHKVAYGEKLVHAGPVFQSMTLRGDALHLKFEHAGSGLTTRDGAPLRGFTIASSDRKFVPVEASIQGNEVIIRPEGRRGPVAVRYAWADNPEAANLLNREGLPASPFRTDEWGDPSEAR